MGRSLSALCAAALLAAACAPPQVGEQSSVRELDPGLLYAPNREHGEKGRFLNPWTEDEHSVFRLIRWQLLTRNPYDKRRDPHVPVVANDGRSLSISPGSAALTWVGHATFAVQDRDDVFLTDPHFGSRALLPRRLQPPGVPIEAVPDHAFAVISHNHYDHLDAWTVRSLPESVTWYVPLGMADWFRRRGRPNVVELDWWQTAERGRWRITCLPSQHWSRRIEQGINRALWCSWLLDSGEHRYYFAGDTGYFHGFAEFGRVFEDIDVAMLPIGAFAPRWFMRQHHMDPAEAYQAFLDLGARYLAAMHWGTFDLTDEPMDLPPKKLAEAVAERGGDPERVRVFAIGERWKLPERADETH